MRRSRSRKDCSAVSAELASGGSAGARRGAPCRGCVSAPEASPFDDRRSSLREALQMLTRLGEHSHRRGARPDQITHRLVGAIWHPYGGQFAGPMQLRQHQRVAAVGLDTIACLHRDQRRRCHSAVVAETGELPVQPIAARAGLITEAHAPATLAQLHRQFGDVFGAIRDGPKLHHLATANPFGNCNRHRCLMDIQPHEDDIVHLARLPCLRLGAS
jgi:hypothetical protein